MNTDIEHDEVEVQHQTHMLVVYRIVDLVYDWHEHDEVIELFDLLLDVMQQIIEHDEVEQVVLITDDVENNE